MSSTPSPSAIPGLTVTKVQPWTHEPEDVPKPLQRAEDYNNEELRRRIDFANKTLQRNITPRSVIWFKMYLAVVERAKSMQVPAEESRRPRSRSRAAANSRSRSLHQPSFERISQSDQSEGSPPIPHDPFTFESDAPHFRARSLSLSSRKSFPFEPPLTLIAAQQMVLDYDLFLKLDECLYRIPTESMQQLIDNTLRLKKLEKFARYGDYMARPLNDIKRAAGVDNRFQGLFQKYWTEVQQNIENEDALIKAHMFKNPKLILKPERIEFTCALYTLSQQTNMDYEGILDTIKMYAQRNELFHSGIDGMVSKGQFSDLAHRLHVDLSDLNTMDKIDEDDIENDSLRTIIKTIRDTYFDVHPDDTDRPEMWWPNATYKAQASGNSTQAQLSQRKQAIRARAMKNDQQRQDDIRLLHHGYTMIQTEGKKAFKDAFWLNDDTVERVLKRYKHYERVVGTAGDALAAMTMQWKEASSVISTMRVVGAALRRSRSSDDTEN